MSFSPSAVASAAAFAGITRRVRLRSTASVKRRSKLRRTSAPGVIPSMRLGVMRRPSTALTLVPVTPRGVRKQMPSPGARSCAPSSVNVPPETPATRPTRFADRLRGVERRHSGALSVQKIVGLPACKTLRRVGREIRDALADGRPHQPRPQGQRLVHRPAVVGHNVPDISEILEPTFYLE